MTLTTTPVHLTIISTAGRDASRPMTGALWDAMCEDLHQRLLGHEHLVSGGAAWADQPSRACLPLRLDQRTDHLSSGSLGAQRPHWPLALGGQLGQLRSPAI